MKCTKCGMEVNDSASFCPACGYKLSENKESNMDVKSYKILQNNTLTKFSYNKSRLVVQLIQAVFSLICFILIFTVRMMAEAKARIRFSSRQYIAFNGDFVGVFTFLAVMALLALIFCVIQCIVIHKLCLCIYNDKIAGVSTKNMNFITTEDFEVKFSDIININQKSNLITIETETKKYMCMIQDAKKAYEMIKSAME